MVDLEKLKLKLETDHKSNKTFGQYVLLPALQNLMGAFALGVLFWIFGYIWIGFSNPFVYPMFRTWVYLICGIIWAILTTIYTFMDEVRIIGALMIVYNMGFKSGLKSNKKVTKSVREVEEQPQRGTELLQDINTILKWYYQTGQTISRDKILSILSNRINSKKNTENALKFMFESGLIKKGPNRNDPIIVSFDTYEKAIKHLKEYIKNNK